jgi:F-type H+-transporting ATPase subunit gamma
MNDIKARIKSVQSTMQITKAMELVATSKLRKAKESVERSRPFHEILRSAIDEIENSREIKDSVWSIPTEGKRTLFIVIAGDRGLAGGYNSNVFKTCRSAAEGTEPIYLPIGKKALEYYRHRGVEIFSDELDAVGEVSVGDTLAIAEKICEGYRSGAFDRVTLVYTKFVSMMSEIPTIEVVLPLEPSEGNVHSRPKDPIMGGDPEEILEHIIPDYVGGVINSAIREALASEMAARRTAMNSANKNAEEMIDTLMLRYNRARQALITQEITEIVSGSEAL